LILKCHIYNALPAYSSTALAVKTGRTQYVKEQAKIHQFNGKIEFLVIFKKKIKMKKFLISMFVCTAIFSFAQTVKSKILKLKYTTPENWTAVEFGGPTNWDESGNAMCHCSGVAFSKPHKNGKYNVVVYAVPRGGLDSTKREFVGSLHFVNVEKVEKITNKSFSFERRRSNFHDTKTNKTSYNCIRYISKPTEGHCYIIYVWQENMDLLNSTSEKELTEMVNAIEPL